MALSKRSQEGYISVDHRASPGIPGDKAIAMGFKPEQVGEGTLFEAPTLICAHCGSVVIVNPARTRAREHCINCDQYICDGCGLERKQSGYIHKSHKEKLEILSKLGVNNG